MSELLEYLISVKGGQQAKAEVGAVRGEFDALEGATGRVSAAQDESVVHSARAAGGLKGVEKNASALRGTLLLVGGALGLGALKVGLDDIVKAGTNFQDQQAQMRSALKGMDPLIGASAAAFHGHGDNLAAMQRQQTAARIEQQRQLSESADKMSTHGGFGESENLQALTRLVTTTGSVTKATRDMGLATDVARRYHIPYLSAVRAVAMAEAGRTTSLTRLGVAVQKGMSGQQALTMLQGKTAGATQAFSRTAAGAMSNATNAIDNAGRAISIGLLPFVTKLANWFAKNLPTAIQGTINIVKNVVGWFDKHKAAADALKGALIVLVGAFTGLFVISKVAALFVALDAAMAANPVALIILGIAALVAGFIELYHHSATFRNILSTIGKVGAAAFGWLKNAVVDVFNWIKGHWPLLLDILLGPFGPPVTWIIKHWRQVTNFFSKMPGEIAGFFSGLADTVGGIFTGIVNGIIKALNFVIGAINGVISGYNAVAGSIPILGGDLTVGKLGTIGQISTGPATGPSNARPHGGKSGGSTPQGVATTSARTGGVTIHGDIVVQVGPHVLARLTRKQLREATVTGA